MQALGKITIAILEDNRSMLTGLKTELDLPGFEVVFGCETVEEFAEKYESTKPEIAIIDIEINPDKGLRGFEVVELINRDSPRTKCIIYTKHNTLEPFHKALKLGVKGYVRKDKDFRAMVSLPEVVRIVAAGGTYFDEELLAEFLHRFYSDKPDYEYENEGVLSEEEKILTPREIEVLSAFVANPGITLKQIAINLGRKYSTLGTHSKNIRHKLGVKTLEAAVTAARLKGYEL